MPKRLPLRVCCWQWRPTPCEKENYVFEIAVKEPEVVHNVPKDDGDAEVFADVR